MNELQLHLLKLFHFAFQFLSRIYTIIFAKSNKLSPPPPPSKVLETNKPLEVVIEVPWVPEVFFLVCGWMFRCVPSPYCALSVFLSVKMVFDAHMTPITLKVQLCFLPVITTL